MFEEDDAIKYIKSNCGNTVKQLQDDDILFIIDCIWDYYESNGLLDIDPDATDETDIPGLLSYVRKAVDKDGEITVDNDTLSEIILKEIAYEKSVEEDF